MRPEQPKSPSPGAPTEEWDAHRKAFLVWVHAVSVYREPSPRPPPATDAEIALWRAERDTRRAAIEAQRQEFEATEGQGYAFRPIEAPPSRDFQPVKYLGQRRKLPGQTSRVSRAGTP